MQPGRELTSFGESDVVGGGFRVSNFPSNAAYNRHISNQPPRQRSTEHLDSRLLTSLAKQRVANRANAYAQYGPYVYHEITPDDAQSYGPSSPAAPQYPPPMRPSPPYNPSLQPTPDQSPRGGATTAAAALAARQQAVHATAAATATVSQQRVAAAPAPALAAAAADGAPPEAPDSPLRGVVRPTAAAASAAAATAAGVVATAEAWLAATDVGDPAAGQRQAGASGSGIGGGGGSGGGGGGGSGGDVDLDVTASGAEVTLQPWQLGAAVQDSSSPAPNHPHEDPRYDPATEPPPTPSAMSGAAVQRVSAAAAPSHPFRGLRALSDAVPPGAAGGAAGRPGGSVLSVDDGAGQQGGGRTGGDSIGGPLPGGSSPRLPGAHTHPSASASAHAFSPSPAGPHSNPRLLRDAGRSPRQAYGYSPRPAGSSLEGPSPGADAGGPPRPSSSPSSLMGSDGAGGVRGGWRQWESMSALENDESYVRYGNLMAKGEFGGNVLHPDFPRESQSGPSYRAYLMRTRTSTSPRTSLSKASRHLAPPPRPHRPASSPPPSAGGAGRGGDGTLAPWMADLERRRQSYEPSHAAERSARRDLWTARSSLAADTRTLRTATRLMRAENRRVEREGAALAESVEGLAEGWASGALVALQAEAVGRRLEEAEAVGALIAGAVSQPHMQRDVGPYGGTSQTATAATAATATAARGEVPATSTAAAGAVAPPTEEQHAQEVEAAGGHYYMAHHYPQHPVAAAAAHHTATAAKRITSGPASGWSDRAKYEAGQLYGKMYSSGGRCKFRYVAPALLRLQRDVAAEVALRRRLGAALGAGEEQRVPDGDDISDPDTMLELIQSVRQSRAEAAQPQAQAGEDPSSQPLGVRRRVTFSQTTAEAGEGPRERNESSPPPPPVGGAEVGVTGEQSEELEGGGGVTAAAGAAVRPHWNQSLRMWLAGDRPVSYTDAEAAAAVAMEVAAEVLAARTASARGVGREAAGSEQQQGGEVGGEEEEEEGGRDQGQQQHEPQQGSRSKAVRRLTPQVARLLNARAAADLIAPRPPPREPPPQPVEDDGALRPPPDDAPAAAHTAYAVMVATGGVKMDLSELRPQPWKSALEQMLAPPASSMLALMYMASRRPVPHPDDFTTEEVEAGEEEGVAAGEDEAEEERREWSEDPQVVPLPASHLSGLPPCGDLFMDLHSPARAPHGQTYRHVEAWSCRDSGLVLERQAREMALAGRERVPVAYLKADAALREPLFLGPEDAGLEDRADELKEQMEREAYDQKVREAADDIQDWGWRRHG